MNLFMMVVMLIGDGLFTWFISYGLIDAYREGKKGDSFSYAFLGFSLFLLTILWSVPFGLFFTL